MPLLPGDRWDRGIRLDRLLWENSGFCRCRCVWHGQQEMSVGTRKRAWRRAKTRAFLHGFTIYKGRTLTRRMVANQVEHLKPVLKPVSSTGDAPKPVRQRRLCAGQQARSPRISCFCWNAGGLSGDKYDALLVFLEEARIQIATIQETHWQFSSEWCTENYLCIHSGAKTASTGGCLTLISKQLTTISCVRFQHVFAGRVLHVRIPLGHTFLNIVNIYQFFKVEGERGEGGPATDQRAALLHRLDQLLHSFSQRHAVLIMGDLNAKLAPLGGLVGHAVGPSSRLPDDELMAIISGHRLVCLNTWLSPTHYTCTGPKGSRSVIDYIMIRQQHVDCQAKMVCPLTEHPLAGINPACHVPLQASISSFCQNWVSSTKKAAKLDVDKFAHDVATHAHDYGVFLCSIQKSLALLPKDDLDVDKIILQVASRMYPAPTSSPPTWSLDPMRSYVQSGWMLWKRLRRLNGSSLWHLFSGWLLVTRLERHKKTHRHAHRRLRRSKLEEYISRTAVAAKNGDQRELHKLIRQLAPRHARIRMQLRGTHGFILSQEDESALIREHMTNQFVDPHAESLMLSTCKHLPFTEMELYDALMHLPARKATPFSCADSIFIKFSAAVIASDLFSRLRSSWENAYAAIPQTWRCSWITWIPKPLKDHTKMSGWRGIALQNAVGKAVLKCVEKSTRSNCSTDLNRDPQFAYAAGRGTGEAIFRAMVHQATALKLGRDTNLSHHDLKAGRVSADLGGGFQICLDIEKAFDLVDRSRLLEAVRKHHGGDDEASLLASWHQETPYVSAQHSDTYVLGNMGVRQGCVAAPTLWNLYIHDFLTKMQDYFPTGWIREHVTVFADDFHLFFCINSESSMATALKDLRRFLDGMIKHGLKINPAKTAVLMYLMGRRARSWRSKLIRGTGPDKKFRLEPLCKEDFSLLFPLVKEHKYLGVMLSYAHCQDATYRLRKQAAMGTFVRLRSWCGSCFPLRQRIKLWFQTVWPTLVYAIADVGLSRKGLLLFNALVFRMLRRLSRSPVHKTHESNSELCIRLGIEIRSRSYVHLSFSSGIVVLVDFSLYPLMILCIR